MNKRFIVCIFLTISTGALVGGGEGDQMSMPMMLPYGASYGSRPDKMREMTFADAFRVGGMNGVIEATGKLTGSCISELVLPLLRRTGFAGSTIGRLMGRIVYGNVGYEAVELYNWLWMLEGIIFTEVLEVAKGAKVIRSHLEQAQSEKEQVLAMPFGMSMLKRDITYLIAQLQQRVVRYRPYDTTVRAVDKAFDVVAVCGLAGAGCYGLCHWSGQDATQEQLTQAVSAARILTAMVSTATNTAASMAQHEVQPVAAQSNYASWHKVKTALPYAIASVAAARLAQWVYAGRAARTLDAVSPIDRALVCHLTDDLIAYLQQLSQLCDEVHDDNDIARLKVKFEGASKHCSDLFARLAYVIDADAATRLQRAGKPGKSGVMQPLAGYGGAHGY